MIAYGVIIDEDVELLIIMLINEAYWSNTSAQKIIISIVTTIHKYLYINILELKSVELWIKIWGVLYGCHPELHGQVESVYKLRHLKRHQKWNQRTKL